MEKRLGSDRLMSLTDRVLYVNKEVLITWDSENRTWHVIL